MPKRLYQKIMLIMRLTTILLIASLMQLSAATRAQKVSLNRTNAPLKTILKELKAQSGYIFLYRDNVLKGAKPVSISIKNADIDQALEQIFKDQPLSYSLNEKTITIKEKEASFLDNIVDRINIYLANITVTGKVVDENGAPLSGASVVLKSNGKGTSTGIDGTFEMRNVEEGAILVVNYIGFNAKEIKAARQIGTIRLTLATNELDQVQIQAYTQTSKRFSLSNSAGVKAKDIENQIISNPLLALQGRVPSLQITQLSGNPGSSVTVRIQGNSSLRATSTPFYVVDGVPYPGTTMPLTGNFNLWGRPEGSPDVGGVRPSLLGEGSGSPLNYLNPNDIESIDVLMDADATAIYGSRAANGAIIITTKKGKPGSTMVDFSAQGGWNKVPFGAKFLNTEQYLAIRREAYRNGNQVFGADAYDINGTWDQTRSTDWQRELFGTTSYSTANLGISGGSVNSNYRVGLTARRERSPYGRDFKNDNMAFSVALNTATANQKFKMGLVANYTNGINNLPNINVIGNYSFLTGLLPNAPSLYNPDGSINWALDPQGVVTFMNPIATNLTNPFEARTNNLTSNLNFNYNILKGLDFKTSFGYTRMDQQEFTGALSSAVAPDALIYFTRMGAFRYTTTNNYIVEPQLSFNRMISNHKINVILGGTYNRSLNETSGFAGYGQSSDALVRNLSAAATFSQNGVGYSEYKYNAVFSRLDYRFMDRYLLGISGRRDGSTRFGPANRFANFWSLAGGWIISEEPWVKNHLKWLSFFKIRTSYGLIGNDGIGDYSFMDLYNATSVAVPYQNIIGFSSRSLFNPNLQWEEKRSLNVGIDANMFDNKITLGVNYNRNRSSNLLQSFTLPVTAGFEVIAINFDALVQNTGWAFVLGMDRMTGKSFQWRLNANLTFPRNKLLALPNQNLIPSVAGFGYEIGKPLGTGKYASYMGVNPLTGLEVNEDLNGNPVVSSNASLLKSTLYDRSVPYRGGLQSDFSYKGFGLNLSFEFAKQVQSRYLFSTDRPGNSMLNQPEITFYLNRWRNPGDVAVFQKYSTLNSAGLVNRGDNLANYEDASYFRLSNVAFNWNIPVDLTKRVGMKSATVGLIAQNVFILSKYSGPNPITGPTALPLIRTIVANLKVGF